MKRRSRTLSIIMSCLLAVVLLAVSGTGVFAAGGKTLEGKTFSEEGWNNFHAQVEVLKAERESRTPVQRKVNYNIIRHLHVNVLRDRPETLPNNKMALTLTKNNEVLTDIKASVSDSVLKMITDNGGTIINKYPEYRAIRALIPITAVETIAAHPDIEYIDEAALGVTNKVNTSEGFWAHNVDKVRNKRNKGYDGAGVKVGVLSNSVDYLAQVQATGDLPAVQVIQDSPGKTGEGTAMLEIVYDLAPAAELLFATASGGSANFAHNILALKDYGCKVIVDDMIYTDESPFQDDVISQAVSTVTKNGVSYFAAAGNQGNKLAGTSGTWEGDYVDSGQGLPGNGHPGGKKHAFAPGVTLNKILQNPVDITLFWSDPLKEFTENYDLYVVDYNSNIGYWSTKDFSDSDLRPIEHIFGSSAGRDLKGLYVVICMPWTDYTRFLHLSAFGGVLAYSTSGATRGHSTVEAAFSVSAVSVWERTRIAFTGAEPLEDFTDDGPRRVFYYPDGAPITPGNLLSTGGKVRKKPDITAADGVHVATSIYSIGHFNPFFGTSAAAPHAAAIADLYRSAHPSATADEIREALTQKALPSAVWNNVGGYGIVMADRVLGILSGGNVVSPATALLLGSP